MSHVENQQRKSSWKEIYDGISYQTLFHAFFSPASRSSLHGGLFDFGCIMSTKGCSLPMPNLCEVSIFPDSNTRQGVALQKWAEVTLFPNSLLPVSK